MKWVPNHTCCLMRDKSNSSALMKPMEIWAQINQTTVSLFTQSDLNQRTGSIISKKPVEVMRTASKDPKMKIRNVPLLSGKPRWVEITTELVMHATLIKTHAHVALILIHGLSRMLITRTPMSSVTIPKCGVLDLMRKEHQLDIMINSLTIK